MKLRSFVLGGVLAIAAVPSALAIQTTYEATLSGANESPPTASTAAGQVTLLYDSVVHSLAIQLTFANLSAPAVAGHIHCCTLPGSNVGVAVPFGGLPNTVLGAYANTFDLLSSTSYSGAFLSAHGGTAASAEAALIAGIGSGMAYVNLHDGLFPGGEIRGFLQTVPAPVPEPGAWALMLAGVGLLGALARRRNARPWFVGRAHFWTVAPSR